VKRVSGRQIFVGVEVEPALSAIRSGACIPGHREGLEPTARETYQQLLKRMDSEGIGHFELDGSAVDTTRRHQEGSVAPRKPGRHSEVLELCAVEVPEQRLWAGLLDGEVMVGTAPQRRLIRVTACALVNPHEARGLGNLASIGFRDLAAIVLCGHTSV
jgi:hypothetical protein